MSNETEDIFYEFSHMIEFSPLTEESKNKFRRYINTIFVRPRFYSYGSRKYTFLQEAVGEGRLDVVEWLLENGADPNINVTGPNGAPLHEAALSTYGETCMIDILLKYGANPNLYDNTGSTPLWYVIDNDRYANCVQSLLNYGAYAYKPNKYNPNKIPYHFASEKNKKIIDRHLGRE